MFSSGLWNFSFEQNNNSCNSVPSCLQIHRCKVIGAINNEAKQENCSSNSWLFRDFCFNYQH